MPTNLLRLLAATALAVGAVLLVPSTAHACSCVAAGDARYARWAEVVAVGTVVDREPPPWWRQLHSSRDAVTYEMAVDRVLKGAAGTTIALRSPSSEATCGIALAVGTTYVLYAQAGPGDDLSVGLCGGTGVATPAAVKAVEDLLGPAYPPDRGEVPPPGAEASVWPLGVGGLLAAGGAALAAALAVVGGVRAAGGAGRARAR
jgi:hypothetical protein